MATVTDATAATAVPGENSAALQVGPLGLGDKAVGKDEDMEVIRVDGKKTLRIEAADLVLSDLAVTKRSRTCGIGAHKSPSSKSIPLYNILWAEVSGSELQIDYAEQISTTKVRVARWKFGLSDNVAEVSLWAATLLSRAYGPAKLRKRAKVLVNPHAGPGGARKLWEGEARPVFEAARMTLDVVQTKYSGEAVELAQAMDIEAYDTVVACSGDGLPHEVFNGLAKRPDARKALAKIAVSHVPCGSGNAMSCNLYGTHRAGLAALAIVKGVETSLDLVSITQGDRRIVSFLSQSLGIVAESDLATEHLRWMGESRFTYGLLVRMARKKVYPCDLAVKVEIDHKEGVKEHYRRERSLPSLKAQAQGNDKVNSSGDEGDSGSSVAANEDCLPPLKYGTINDKLPDGWELVPHDKMGTFYCGNMAYMAPDTNMFSAACANDGFMDLVSIDGDVSLATNLDMFLSVESGQFFDKPLVSYRKIVAYRIIPRDQKDGYISIDGERVPFEPFQAEIHRGLGTVISKRGVFEAPGPRNWDKVTVAERMHA